MGDEIKKRFTTEIELIAGSNGVFEITADGKEIFSKKTANRFPETEEIMSLLDKL